MELKLNPNGKVAFLLKTGSHQVRGEMLEAEAKDIIRRGNVKQSNGQIIVDDKFIFGEVDKPLKEAVKEEEPKNDVAIRDVPLKEAVKKTTKKKMVDNADKKPLSSKPLTSKKKK